MADLRLAPLPVQGADRRIIIERGFLDIGERFDVARPRVDPGGGGPRDYRIVQMVLPGDVIARIGKPY